MERIDSLPFKEALIDNEWTNKHPKIREIKNSGFITRIHLLSPDAQLNSELIDDYHGASKMWKDLASYAGINLPKYTGIVASPDSKNPYLYIVTQKIKGDNLEDIIIPPQEREKAAGHFDEFMTGIVKYAENVYQKKSEYLSDQNLSQYVYDGERVYFVDLGYESSKIRDEDDESRFFAMFGYTVMTMIEDLEKKTTSNFDEARDNYIKFLSKLPASYPGSGYAKNILSQLRQPYLPGI